MSDLETPPTEAAPSEGTEGEILDLDAARKARHEKQGEPPKIKFFGEFYPMPRSLPANVIDLIGEVNGGDLTKASEAFTVLIGGRPVFDKLTEAAKAHDEVLEFDDIVFLLEKALEIYEVTLPESSASAPQS